MLIQKKIRMIAKSIEPRLIEIRRQLHMYPELAFGERKTAELIVSILNELDGIEVHKGLSKGTGIVALLSGNRGKGKTVLLRADIDALPITEKTGLPYSSCNPGHMHACGHDAHTTWLLGSAIILNELRNEFSGIIKFVFQPAEECGGSDIMINHDNILENPNVDAVFAAHCWPTIDAGKVGIANKYAFGSTGSFRLKVIGKGGHGSWPHECVDPIAISNQIYNNIQQVISRKIDAVEPRVISIGSIHSGPLDKGNIIPDTCTMLGTLRSTNPDIIIKMKDEIEKIAYYTTIANDATYELDVSTNGKPVINHPILVECCAESAIKILGEENVFIINKPHLGGEDFSLYTNKKPGAYFFVGTANDKTRGKFGLHSPNFDIDESVLSKTASIFTEIALSYLNNFSNRF